MDFALNDEQAILKDHLTSFAKRELNQHLADKEQQGEFVWESWKKCSDMGLAGLLIPKEYGGMGVDLTTGLIGMKALSYGCEDGGLMMALVTQICCGVQIRLFGSALQQREYLPAIASGEKITAQALTEPDAGSDVRSMKMKARKVQNKYILNGTKMFISNGPIADLVMLFAAEEDPRKSPLRGLSCLLVEKGMKGFQQGKALEKMGLRTLQNGELVLEECEVPVGNLIGREGQGMFIFNEVIEWERALISAYHLGIMERMLEKCTEYVKTRHQFGRQIGKFQSISTKIAEMKLNLELGKLILYKTGWLKDQKRRAYLETSIAKLFISENLKKACLEAIQIHGAYGYMKEFGVERELRNSIASTIYSGTSEIQRNVISGLVGL